MRSVLAILLAFLLVPAFAAPTPNPPGHEKKLTIPNQGDVVGVRVGKLGEPHNRKVDIHPAVVVSGPHEDGTYGVATISKKHPHDPPQTPIVNFHHDMKGNVNLGPARHAEVKDMKPWKSSTTGERQTPLTPQNLDKLKAAMVPHAAWRGPTPPAVRTPPSPSQSQHIHAAASGSRHPASGHGNSRAHHPYAYARPASRSPPQQNRASGSSHGRPVRGHQ